VLVPVEEMCAPQFLNCCSHRFSSQLLRQEKDEASPVNCLRRDSLNAFIPRLAVKEGFFISGGPPLPRR
jgi:hypothetical protein